MHADPSFTSAHRKSYNRTCRFLGKRNMWVVGLHGSDIKARTSKVHILRDSRELASSSQMFRRSLLSTVVAALFVLASAAPQVEQIEEVQYVDVDQSITTSTTTASNDIPPACTRLAVRKEW